MTIPTRSVTPVERSSRQPRTWLKLLLVLFAVLAIVVAVVTTIVIGPDSYLRIARDDPGRLTSVLTVVVRAVCELAALVTVGGLASAVLVGRQRPVRGGGSKRQLEVAEWFEPFVIRRAAATWAISAGLLVLLDALDSNGQPLSRLADLSAVGFSMFGGDAARAWMVACAAAIAAWVTGALAVRWVTYGVVLVVALLGSLAPVVVGQVLVGPNHDFGSDAAIYQTVAGQVLFGLVVVQALRMATGRRVRVGERPRWKLVAIALPAVTVVAEVVLLWFKLAGSSPTASATGWFELVRLASLVIISIGLFSYSHEWTKAGVLLAVAGIGVFVAAGIAMTRIPPPQFFVPTSVSQIFFGFDLPGRPSFGTLFGQWRPNLLFAVAAVVAITGYLLAARRVRRRGEHWPVLRTIAWVIGWVLIVVVTSSGLGKYSGADFAIHMVVHMTLSMLAPIPLVLAGPLTLLLRALPTARDGRPGPYEWITAGLHSRFLRALYHPLLVFVLYIGSYYALYLTGAFGTLMKFHWAHQLMNVHFLLVGCLYFGLVIGVDQTPRKLPSLAKLGYIMAAMPFHAFFGVILMSGGIIGEEFYQHLDLPWARDLAGTQQAGGGVAWAGGEIPLLIVVIVLALQWAIQDKKEARRLDRHLDSGLDDSHDAYNAMLARLAERGGAERTGAERAGAERAGAERAGAERSGKDLT
ncbi:cytochrome c oxidase assembly protein [Kribbella solani]|uniref:Putative copper resistance protein D n=1 Tax=Kribbella solani TaxID=236067 RepID=A0A841DNB2_9ACTN|nr:cytochrome c oxidase assembly protein [Kribbella solani]MBB5977887.1 putative copper resistance protein D [Kribbella solani]